MTVQELMTGITPSASYEGIATNDDFVLAIDISADGDGDDPKDYAVFAEGVTSQDAQLETESDDKTYLHKGRRTLKTSTQRTFNISGDRAIGEDVLDFIMSHSIKYGVGQAVIRNYVYFCTLTGKGETGKVSIIVNSDGNGDAGATAEIDVDVKAVGVPTEYTYSASAGTGG